MDKNFVAMELSYKLERLDDENFFAAALEILDWLEQWGLLNELHEPLQESLQDDA